MTVRLLIADDHAVVQEGLRLVMGLDSSVEVLEEEACTGRQAVELAHRTHTDVILMDPLMPDMDGTAATRMIHAELPDIAVVALTSQLTDSAGSSVLAAARAGAIGYLYKTADVDEPLHAVQQGKPKSPAPPRAKPTPRKRSLVMLAAVGDSLGLRWTLDSEPRTRPAPAASQLARNREGHTTRGTP